jgi:hypothetical protein
VGGETPLIKLKPTVSVLRWWLPTPSFPKSFNLRKKNMKDKTKLQSMVWTTVWGLQKRYCVPITLVAWGFDKQDAVKSVVENLNWIKKPSKKRIAEMLKKTKEYKTKGR